MKNLVLKRKHVNKNSKRRNERDIKNRPLSRNVGQLNVETEWKKRWSPLASGNGSPLNTPTICLVGGQKQMLRSKERDTQRASVGNNGDLIEPLWRHNSPPTMTRSHCGPRVTKKLLVFGFCSPERTGRCFVVWMWDVC
ncbi:hypothetical protein GWI33_003325 [Rhynchophorus ferrugineus]|uniref:Uncharacterized protein n=1 Tax=Rhynchophorus ferrugineus TaxID=354439 RepID=A0A834MKU8_RHYFE|nr:hypothetical protein GWI33_003325 [Rhynchophorus ferrugineus]